MFSPPNDTASPLSATHGVGRQSRSRPFVRPAFYIAHSEPEITYTSPGAAMECAVVVTGSLPSLRGDRSPTSPADHHRYGAMTVFESGGGTEEETVGMTMAGSFFCRLPTVSPGFSVPVWSR